MGFKPKLKSHLNLVATYSTSSSNFAGRKSDYGEGKLYWVCVKIKGNAKQLGIEYSLVLALSDRLSLHRPFPVKKTGKLTSIISITRRTKRDIFREMVERDESETGNPDVGEVDMTMFNPKSVG